MNGPGSPPESVVEGIERAANGVPPDSIHGFFGLSYAAYLVLPRTALQSMPEDWQARFVEMLDEIEARFGKQMVATYTVGTENRWPDPLIDYERGRRRLTPDPQG